MKILITLFSGFMGFLLLVILAGSIVFNRKYDSKPEAKEFLAGQFPSPALNGDYKGTKFTGIGENWLGKKFEPSNNEGINNFKGVAATEVRYPFQTSRQTGLRSSGQEVLQLNYAYKNNPLWLRFIRDEIVQTDQGTYLGKIHLKIGPLVITLGYFRLEK